MQPSPVEAQTETELKAKQRSLLPSEALWGPAIMKAGWFVFPSLLLERQQILGLDPLDVNILLHLMRFWWTPGNPPHPSKLAIAECIGVDVSTIRRRIADLEKAGFIRREARYSKKLGRMTNAYHLDGLIEVLRPMAERFLERKRQRKKEDEEARKRRQPRGVQQS